ncbi:MAG: aldose 1-epimerase [Ruminococcaceae bacterium]|nr:aldose 1-epimerase [Oscillospiraceae bacterium]
MIKTYEIKSGLWQAKISAELGANVVSLKYDGKDVFVPLENMEQLTANPYIQGAPILLPANRTADGKFSFEGKAYQLEITEASTGANLHGIVHRQAFTVIEHGRDKITLSFENKGLAYPFFFVLTVTYYFENGAFAQRYDIKNNGSCNMPFTFALHTTFVEPESFSVPIDACHKKNEKHLPIGSYFPLNEQESRYVTGSPSKDLMVSGYYRACGHTAYVGDFSYTASDNFNHWILFNGAGKRGLLCVEPQCGAVNGLNIEGGCKVLAPNETETLFTFIKKT